MPILLRTLTLSLAAAFATPLFAQQDAAPVDIAQLLQALRSIKDQQAQQLKAAKQKAMQDAQAAAASPSVAAAAWEEAVRQTQFEGAAREGSAFRDWKDKEGSALKEAEAQNAARLYFQWLAITLQRSAGAQPKELLSAVVQHTKDVTAHQNVIEALDEKIKRERELSTATRPGSKDRRREDEAVKRMSDQILRGGLGGSPPVKALNLGDFVNVDKWEQSPGDVDGIFNSVILPELRAARDPRLMEYWDMRLKRETEAASKAKLSFEIEKFNQVRRPEILWNKAQDEIVIGQKNKGIMDMFTLIKTYPTHPRATEWVSRLEEVLLPPAPATGATPAVQ